MATRRSRVKGRGIPRFAAAEKTDLVRGDLAGVDGFLLGVVVGVDTNFLFVGVLRILLLLELELRREKSRMSCFCGV
jgi:hypothetical protein